MSTELATSTDESVSDAVARLKSDRGIESKSKAVECGLKAGLQRLGYLGGGKTPAQSLLNGVAVSVFHVGATLMMLSLFGSLAFFGAAIGVLGGSLALAVISRWAVPRVEPSLTNRLPRIEVRVR